MEITEDNTLPPVPDSQQPPVTPPVKKEKRGFLFRSIKWVSSSFSRTVEKISKYAPSLNKVAGTLVVGSYVAGTVYALSNPAPGESSDSYDYAGGAAFALSSSWAISSVTATIQYMRGRKEDVVAWAVITVATGLVYNNYEREIEVRNTLKLAVGCHEEGIGLANHNIYRVDCAHLEIAKKYIDKGEVETLPRSKDGLRGVRFLKDAPVVIKPSPFPGLVKDIDEAHGICKKNNYHHLTIAKATYYQKHIVHSLLPISSSREHGGKLQMGFYIENKDHFTDAIKEFTGFLCQCHLGDLINHGVIGGIFAENIPRFDNLVPYLEESEGKVTGKIALVDLDQFSSTPPKNFVWGIEKVIRFFPYHYEEIMEVIQKFHPLSSEDRHKLESVHYEAQKLYQEVYENHASYLKTKKIEFSNPAALSPLTPDALERVEKSILRRLGQEHVDSDHTPGMCYYHASALKGFLGDKPEEALKQIRACLPDIIKGLNQFLDDLIEENAKSKPAEVTSYGQLASLRTLEFSPYDKRLKSLVDEVQSRLTIPFKHLSSAFAKFITNIFDEMAKEGHIASVHWEKYSRHIYIHY